MNYHLIQCKVPLFDAPPLIVTGPRQRRFPRALKDFVPTSHTPQQLHRQLTPTPPPPSPIHASHVPSPSPMPQLEANSEALISDLDEWGIYRIYQEAPSRASDEGLAPDYGCDAPTFDIVHEAQNNEQGKNPYAPFSNASTYRLTKWWFDGGNRSLKGFDSLVNDVLLSPDFCLDDLEDFNATAELKKLTDFSNVGQQPGGGRSQKLPPVPFQPSDGWRIGEVDLKVPGRWKSEQAAPTIRIGNIPYRNLVDMLQSAVQDQEFLCYHLKGFEEHWIPLGSKQDERIYREVYTSPAYLAMEEVHAELEPSNFETVVIPLLWGSDMTHLTSFGTAALWPGYVSLGNLSKYTRCKPSSLSMYHAIYFPSVSLIIFILLYLNH